MWLDFYDAHFTLFQLYGFKIGHNKLPVTNHKQKHPIQYFSISNEEVQRFVYFIVYHQTDIGLTLTFRLIDSSYERKKKELFSIIAFLKWVGISAHHLNVECLFFYIKTNRIFHHNSSIIIMVVIYIWICFHLLNIIHFIIIIIYLHRLYVPSGSI